MPIYQVDAFADQAFSGNPAAVMPLVEWPDDAMLQALAAENNLSETAFFVPEGEGFRLRWFTPAVEVDLCGHATLASAHVLYRHLGYAASSIRFSTRSGELVVSRQGDTYVMDFPAPEMVPVAVDVAVSSALGAQAIEALLPATRPSMMVYVFDSEATVAGLTPDFSELKRATPHAVIATAPGDSRDFVSRFFGPQVGIDEDPVTGSAHCCLTVYWSAKLATAQLRARQISPRGGDVHCRLAGHRVVLSGTAVTFMEGTVYLPD
jgi:PhzF family phenazine biosynthesis protein